MDNPGEILRLCRLCLVKDQVNIPIFEEQGDIRQIFLKISSCLPVTVSRDDQLPKKICDGCSNKLDLLYEFWNTSANAEKTLLSWLGQAGVKDADETISAVAQQIAKPAETQVKQENLEDGHAIISQQDNFGLQSFDEDTKDEAEPPPRKRARRTAAVKAQISIAPESDDDDDDMDNTEAMTKVEGESEESDGEDRDPSYGEVPGTSADDQAGPSGVGKDGVEAPVQIFLKQEPLSPLQKQCNICFKYFKETRRLNQHLVSHQTERPHKCPICPKAFKRKYEVTNHMVVHGLNAASFNCDYCTKVFKTKQTFLVHRSRHLKEYVINCPVCNRGFVTKNEYELHFNVKHGTNPNVCEICGRRCYDKVTLTNHIKTHQEGYHIEKYECKFCNKKFAQLKGLEQHHIRIHKDGGQKYVCDICGKEVHSKESLRDHINTHNGLKPAQCPTCNKSFVLKKTLKQHMLTHTGEKPHSCSHCGKRFTQRGPLRAHLKGHLGEKAFGCDLCSSKFVTKAQLNYHVKNKHSKI